MVWSAAGEGWVCIHGVGTRYLLLLFNLTLNDTLKSQTTEFQLFIAE